MALARTLILVISSKTLTGTMGGKLMVNNVILIQKQKKINNDSTRASN